MGAFRNLVIASAVAAGSIHGISEFTGAQEHVERADCIAQELYDFPEPIRDCRQLGNLVISETALQDELRAARTHNRMAWLGISGAAAGITIAAVGAVRRTQIDQPPQLAQGVDR